MQTEAFTHRHVYTQKVLQIEALTAHRNFYTEQLLHRSFYTKKAFTLYTEKFLHTGAFAQGNFTQESFYTQKPFTHGSFCTGWLLHREVLHREAFTRRRVYTEKSLHRGAFAHRILYTPTRSHTEGFKNRQLYGAQKFYMEQLFAAILAHTEGAFIHRSFYTKPNDTQLLHTEAFTIFYIKN